MKEKVPVLFIIFNRPDTTEKVFNAIKQYQPDKLYVASDGARDSIFGENEIVEKTRDSVINRIDWDCEVKTFFREENVGCGRGPSDAITWFFEHEEMGIILEDDCVPSLPFYDFCEKLLKKYQHNSQVWIISGRSHFTDEKFFKEQDYLFSNYVVTWGWATWKRCWDNFDINLKNYWPDFYQTGGFKNVFFTKNEGRFRNIYYNHLLKDNELVSHVWDYQFLLNMNQNGGLGVVPSKNLVENIGYEGTHFIGTTKVQKLKAAENFTINKEPKNVLPNRKYETHYFNRDFRQRLAAFILNRYLRMKILFNSNSRSK